jgi:hypothetical protein
MNVEPTESSETSASNTQTPGIYPKESILHLEHGESLKSRKSLHGYKNYIIDRTRRINEFAIYW